MFKHILMPTDGTTRSEAAVRFGMRLAKAHGARATALTVVDVGQRARARAHLDFVEHVAKGSGVACDVVTEHGDKPYEHIVAAAHKLGCDLIVMATHAREGVEALVLGSQTQKVLARSKVPVVVCRE
jgi:nucleotide-binding universal stress UspA family protein